MKQGSTTLLRLTIFLLGLGALVIAVWPIPLAIMTDETGFYKPILIGMYFPAIPFFIALFQATKLLSYIDSNKAFSIASVKALKIIKYCAFVVSGLYTAGMPYIFYAADRDDAPGVVAIGLVIVGASFVLAVFAALLQRLVESAVDMKSENDLTV